VSAVRQAFEPDGEAGPQEKTAEFGRQIIVSFLREGGAGLLEADEGRKYVRRATAVNS